MTNDEAFAKVRAASWTAALAALCAYLAMLMVASGRENNGVFVALYILLSAFFATLATWVGTEA